MKSFIALLTFTSLALGQSSVDSSSCDWQCRYDGIRNSPQIQSMASICNSNSNDIDYINCFYNTLGYDKNSVDQIIRKVIASKKYCPDEKGGYIISCLYDHYGLDTDNSSDINNCMDNCSQNTLIGLWKCGSSCNQDLFNGLIGDSNLNYELSSPTVINATSSSQKSSNSTKPIVSEPTTSSWTPLDPNNGVSKKQSNSFYSIILASIFALCIL